MEEKGANRENQKYVDHRVRGGKKYLTHTHTLKHTHTLSSPRSRKGCLRKRGTRSRRCVHNNTQRHNDTDAESHSPNLIHRISFAESHSQSLIHRTEFRMSCARVAEGVPAGCEHPETQSNTRTYGTKKSSYVHAYIGKNGKWRKKVLIEKIKNTWTTVYEAGKNT